MNLSSIPGEYYLEGAREMASGFFLKPDNSFHFFFSYGALDRQATGQWKLNDDKVIFNSAEWAGYDFSLVKSGKQENDFTRISLETANPLLGIYIYCSLQNGQAESWKAFDQRGELILPPQQVNTISLLCEFTSERQTHIPVPANGHNDFGVKIEPWLFDYYFKDFELKRGEKGLTGPHPFLQKEEFFYRKS